MMTSQRNSSDAHSEQRVWMTPKLSPPHQSVGKLLPQNLSLVPERLGTTGVNDEGTRSQRPTSALQCSGSAGNDRGISAARAPFSHQLSKRDVQQDGPSAAFSSSAMVCPSEPSHLLTSKSQPLTASHRRGASTACSYCQGLVSTKLPLPGPMAGGGGKPA